MNQAPILSFSWAQDVLWAAGPGGLLALGIQGQQQIIPQPMQGLVCCLAWGEGILVGGAPYGVALHPRRAELAQGLPGAEAQWQAAHMDQVDAPVVCLAGGADPDGETRLLAGTQGAGILGSGDGGRTWQASNFGLHCLDILALAWTVPPPAQVWPRWSLVFAATDAGLFRSPNGGRAWKAAACPPHPFLCVAPAPDFQRSRLVLAGSDGAGLFRSSDGGRSFQPVADSPAQINSVIPVAGGWVLSDGEQVWRSADGERWQPIPGSAGALVLFHHDNRLFGGTEAGILSMETPSWT